MTDKQIIIDDQKKTIHRLQDECTEKTNVIIALGEQLKAKTQECEDLKETIQIQNKMQMEVCEEKNTELDQLKAENEELRKERNKFKKQYRKNRIDRKQAEQKLKKIKDKCNETLELMDKDSGTNAYAGDRCTEAGQIIQIIDEVE